MTEILHGKQSQATCDLEQYNLKPVSLYMTVPLQKTTDHHDIHPYIR